ncbi:MAG: Na+/H+ antiporter NhaA, partial [Muribaculaceae bacterium]|nr:Na+/H+ antiporter NhaA [Muribaculaceae bacterium]
MTHTTIQEDQTGHNVFYAARQALRRHASGGNVLIAATVLALVVANIPAINGYYFDFWNQEVRLQIGSFNLFSHNGHPMTMLQFINDALMAIFFFSIGLEIKREVLVGELSSFKQALLPIVAAVGGMVVPVVIFFCLSSGTDYANGAAIPMATDIAFSLGVLAMLGSRVPISLKIFLTTLAVVDDIGGIIVIAAFYSTHIEAMLLVYAACLLGVLLLGSWMRIQSKIFYLTIGTAVWFLFLNSGIHPTIAGVLVAFCIPATPVFAPKKYIKKIRSSISKFRAEDDELLSRRSILTKEQMNYLKEVESASDKVISPLQELEDSLHPIVNFFIVPLFAFANAGIFLLDMDAATIIEGISLAVILGLVVGKFIGIFVFSWLTIKLKLAPMPVRSNWKMLGAVSM